MPLAQQQRPWVRRFDFVACIISNVELSRKSHCISRSVQNRQKQYHEYGACILQQTEKLQVMLLLSLKCQSSVPCANVTCGREIMRKLSVVLRMLADDNGGIFLHAQSTRSTQLSLQHLQMPVFYN